MMAESDVFTGEIFAFRLRSPRQYRRKSAQKRHRVFTGDNTNDTLCPEPLIFLVNHLSF